MKELKCFGITERSLDKDGFVCECLRTDPITILYVMNTESRQRLKCFIHHYKCVMVG